MYFSIENVITKASCDKNIRVYNHHYYQHRHLLQIKFLSTSVDSLGGTLSRVTTTFRKGAAKIRTNSDLCLRGRLSGHRNVYLYVRIRSLLSKHIAMITSKADEAKTEQIASALFTLRSYGLQLTDTISPI